jgi:hypothetical protein
MAVFTTENFDSYADGNNLSGLSGGVGWTNNWSTSGTNVLVTNARSQSGTLSLRKNVTAYRNAARSHTATKDLKYTFWLFRAGATDNNVEVLAISSTNSFRFRCNGTNTWNIDINGTPQSGGSWTNSQWNKVEIAVNQTGNTLKVSINEGAEVSHTFTNSGNNFYEFYLIWPANDANGAFYDSITIDDDLTFDKDKSGGSTSRRLLMMGVG